MIATFRLKDGTEHVEQVPDTQRPRENRVLYVPGRGEVLMQINVDLWFKRTPARLVYDEVLGWSATKGPY